jgi:DNA-binding NarL/FixJ family response regulator
MRERVLVLGRNRLVAEATARALGGGAAGMTPAKAERWLPACDGTFSVVVVDATTSSQAVLRLLSTVLPTAAVVLIVTEHQTVPLTWRRRHPAVSTVTRRDGLDALRRQIHVVRGRVGTMRRPVSFTGGDGALTMREHEVGALMAAGRSNHEIAGALGVSVHTVRSHVQRILLKLAVPNRFAAADALRRPALAAHPIKDLHDQRLVEGGVG